MLRGTFCHAYCTACKTYLYLLPIYLLRHCCVAQVGAELQASEPDELEEGEMKDRVHQALTRK